MGDGDCSTDALPDCESNACVECNDDDSCPLTGGEAEQVTCDFANLECVQCLDSTDCTEDDPTFGDRNFCSTDKECVECLTSTDCTDDDATFGDRNFCSTDNECVECLTSTECTSDDATFGDRDFCNDDNECVECLVQTDCELFESCNSQVCECDSARCPESYQSCQSDVCACDSSLCPENFICDSSDPSTCSVAVECRNDVGDTDDDFCERTSLNCDAGNTCVCDDTDPTGQCFIDGGSCADGECILTACTDDTDYTQCGDDQVCRTSTSPAGTNCFSTAIRCLTDDGTPIPDACPDNFECPAVPTSGIADANVNCAPICTSPTSCDGYKCPGDLVLSNSCGSDVTNTVFVCKCIPPP